MTKDVLVRSLPDDVYETVRRVAFEANTNYAEVVAYAVRNVVDGRHADAAGAVPDAFRNLGASNKVDTAKRSRR